MEQITLESELSDASNKAEMVSSMLISMVENPSQFNNEVIMGLSSTVGDIQKVLERAYQEITK